MKIQKSELSHPFLKGLGEIPTPPAQLWQQGDLPEMGGKKVVSIVGSRNNTRYGEEVAYRLAYDLAKQGIIVVSGMAYGIDTCAHRGCLDAGGTTVAVLGTPIDRIYPVRNTQLAKRIIEKGAIVSEYAPGQPTNEWSFVERNRIVSGLADAVVIVEAATKSGTLTTAAHALEQGRDVFAVPGDITRPMSVGCNRLIKQGAMPFTHIDDILGVLFPERAKQMKFAVFGDTPEEQNIIDAIVSGERDGDKIIESTGMTAQKFNQTISLLEIKNLVRSLGANQWTFV